MLAQLRGCPTLCGRPTSPGTRAIVAYERNHCRSPLKEIQERTGLKRSMISDIAIHSAKQAKLHGSESFHSENSLPGMRSGAPPLLHDDQINALVTLATSSYDWRRRKWIDVASELGIPGTEPTIAKAFYSRGYGRYSPQQKPFLTADMKEQRDIWCKNKEDWDVTALHPGWRMVIYSDETSVILGELQGRKGVTRTKDEEWEEACLEKAFKTYSTFMFFGSIAWGWKGPCHIYQPELKSD